MERELWLGGGRVGGVGNIFFFFSKAKLEMNWQKWKGLKNCNWKPSCPRSGWNKAGRKRMIQNQLLQHLWGRRNHPAPGALLTGPATPCTFLFKCRTVDWLQLRKFIQREWCLPTSQGKSEDQMKISLWWHLLCQEDYLKRYLIMLLQDDSLLKGRKAQGYFKINLNEKDQI